MRIIKISAISLLFMLLIGTFFYNTRHYIAEKIAAPYLAKHQLKIECLSFQFKRSFTIQIDKLCLSSPAANIIIDDLSIAGKYEDRWQLKALKIKQAHMQLNESFNSIITADSKTTRHNAMYWQQQLSNAYQQLQSFSLPFTIDIEKLSYEPFYSDTNSLSSATNYHGAIKASAQQLEIILATQKQQILALTLKKQAQQIQGKIAAELAPLNTLIQQHNTPFQAQLSKFDLTKGSLISHFTWQAKKLTLTNQLRQLQLVTNIPKLPAINVKATLLWQTTLTDKNIRNQFTRSDVTIDYQINELQNWLQLASMPTQLNEFLTDNPIEQIAITDIQQLDIDLSKQNIQLAQVKLHTPKYKLNNQLTISAATFNYQQEAKSKPPLALKTLTFALEANTIVSKLNPFSQQPVVSQLSGTLSQENQHFSVSLFPSSRVTFAELQLVMQDQHAKPFTIAKIDTNLSGKINLSPAINTELAFNSSIEQLQLTDMATFKQNKLTGTLKGNLNTFTLQSQLTHEQITLANIKLTGNNTQAQLSISGQHIPIPQLHALPINWPSKAEFSDGELSYQLSGQLNELTRLAENGLNLTATVSNLTGNIEGIKFVGLQSQQHFNFNNGQLNTNSNEHNFIKLDKVSTAIDIEQIYTETFFQLNSQQLTTKLNQSSGNMLGGSFSIEHLQWPLTTRSVKVKLDSIDLEKVLELDPKQGIVVTGKISGELPVYVKQQQFKIADGELHNISQGVIQIKNNPAVNELKQQNSQLKLAFNALENLHYHQLSSHVAMESDGYMQLDTKIIGRNPDLDNDVNLNLNLSYDLLGLLESLSITSQFEKKLIENIETH